MAGRFTNRPYGQAFSRRARRVRSGEPAPFVFDAGLSQGWFANRPCCVRSHDRRAKAEKKLQSQREPAAPWSNLKNFIWFRHDILPDNSDKI
jgi:hypothetical protein